jgi:hypothetical protein
MDGVNEERGYSLMKKPKQGARERKRVGIHCYILSNDASRSALNAIPL